MMYVLELAIAQSEGDCEKMTVRSQVVACGCSDVYKEGKIYSRKRNSVPYWCTYKWTSSLMKLVDL